MALRSLTSLGRAHVAQRRGRAIMSAAGIVLGVAMFVAVEGANKGLLASFQEQFEGRTGATDAELVPLGDDNAVLPATVLDELRALPDVARVSANLRVAATRADGATMHLIGVDEELPEIVTVEPAAGRLPAAGASEVAVTEGSDLAVGDQLEALTPAGATSLAVVGLLADEGLGDRDDAEDGVTVAFTSLATARALDQRGEVVRNVRIVLADRAIGRDWVEEHEHAVQGATIFSTEATGSPLGGFGAGLSVVAWLCLFVGAYLIYVTMSGIVVQRTTELGTLRALGANRKQIRKLVRAEAIAMSMLGGVVGVIFGTALGFLLTVVLSGFVGVDDPAFAFPLRGAIVGFLIGLVVTLLGALVPARRAARLSPVVAMSGDVETRSKTGPGWIAGLVVLPIGIAITSRGASNGLGIVVLMAGAVLLVPPLLAPVVKAVAPLASKLAPGIGRITVLQILGEKARSAGTLAVVMVILGFGLGLIITVDGMKQGAARLVEQTTMADVQVMNPGLIPPAAVDLVRTTPGVAAVSPQWFGRTSIVRTPNDQSHAWLSLVDPTSYFEVSGFDLEAGTTESVRFGLGAGGAVVLGEHLAETLDLTAGDTITLETAEGPTPFTVAGVHNARFTFAGEIVASIADGPRFGAGSPGGLLVSVTEGAALDDVGNDIRRRLHGNAGVGFGGGRTSVATRTEVADQINGEVDAQLNIFYGVSAVAGLIALLGMANTLGISVLQRRREHGLLRAVGARKRQISRSVLVESATLSAAAFLLALPLGYLVGLAFGGNASQFVGWDVSMRPPVFATGAILLMTIGIGAAAALAPARRAGRLQIVDALRVD